MSKLAQIPEVGVAATCGRFGTVRHWRRGEMAGLDVAADRLASLGSIPCGSSTGATARAG